MITLNEAKKRYGIYCNVCDTDNMMEVSEIIDNTCYCSCINCKNSTTVNEFSKVTLSDNKSYIFSAVNNAFYIKGGRSGIHYDKFGFTKNGDLKKREEVITYRNSEFTYLETNNVA